MLFVFLFLSTVSSKAYTGTNDLLLGQFNSDNASSCYLEKAPFIVNILNKEVNDFTQSISGQNSEASALFSFANTVSKAAVLYIQGNFKLTDAQDIINQTSAFVTKHSDLSVIVNELAIAYAYESDAFWEFWSRFVKALQPVAQSIGAAESRPFYFGDELFRAISYALKSILLQKIQNQDKCIPFNSIKDFDEQFCELNNQLVSFTTIQQNTFPINKQDINNGRVTIGFWFNVSLQSVTNGVNDVFVYSVDDKQINVKLLPNSTGDGVIIVLNVGAKSFTFQSVIHCDDIIFGLLNIEKEYDGYNLSFTIRSTVLNNRENVNLHVPPCYIEFGGFNFPNTGIVYSQDIFRIQLIRSCLGLSVSELIEQEILVINQITDSAHTTTQKNLADNCKHTPNNCVYVSGSSCLVCAKDFFLHQGGCVNPCPAGFFADEATRKCQPCDVTCETCTDIKTCNSCAKGFFLFNHTCVVACPNDTWPVDGVCTPCTANCLLCGSATKCVICKLGFLQADGTCIDQCPAYTYPTFNPNVCKNCSEHCPQCVNDTKCTKCDDKFYLSKGECVGTCPDGTFKCDKSGKCQICPAQCATCNTKTDCTLCETGFNLSNGACVTNCPAGSVPKNGFCINCSDSKCNVCDPDDTTICYDCKSGFLLHSKCVTECGDGYYADKSNVCQPCIDNCSQCADHATCNHCAHGFFLYTSGTSVSCVSDCGNGYVGIDGVCVPCDTNSHCKTCCAKNTSKCVTCFEGSYFNTVTNTCVSECPAGTYVSGTSCLPCNKNCVTCTNAFTCEVCVSPLLMQPDGTCAETCNDGYTPLHSICKPCQITECKKCDSNVSTCDECTLPSLIYHKSCVPTCPKGSFQLGPVCIDCFENCAACSDGITCDQCVDPFVLLPDHSKCVAACPERTVNINGVCTPCENTKCLTCAQDLQSCNTCPVGYFYYQKDCYGQCPEFTVPNTEKNICEDCTKPCKHCVESVDHCVDCIKDFVLKPDHTCANNCDPNFANVNNVCVPCKQSECLTCDSNLTTCHNCQEGTFLNLDNTCVNPCPISTFPLNGKCNKCLEGCDICKCDKKCISCSPGYSLKDKICVKDCGDNFVSVQTPAGAVCTQCDANCSKCDAKNIHNCLECQEGTYLLNGVCLPTCPLGYYICNKQKACLPCKVNSCDVCNADPNKCEKCSNNLSVLNGTECTTCPIGYRVNGFVCEKCQVEDCAKCCKNSNTCTKCKDSFYKLDDTHCSTTCPDGTYGIIATQSCVDCDPKCAKCTDATHCTSCKTGFFLNDSQSCVHECIVGFVGNPNTGKCEPCADNCSHCNPVNHAICTSCNAGFFLLNNVCVKDCGDGYFADSSTGLCQPCNLTCATCSDANTCITCIPSYDLYENKCVDHCPDAFVAINQKCIPCKTSTLCKKCSQQDITICIDCGSNILFEGRCITECPAGYRLLSNNTCEKCIDNCKTCSDSKTCDVCVSPFVLKSNKTCDTQCCDGYVAIDSVCQLCDDSHCKVCDQTKTCTLCKSGFILKVSGGAAICVTDCGSGFYQDGNNCKKCTDANCVDCKEANKCNACGNGFSLYENTCVADCPSGFVSINHVCAPCDTGCSACSNVDQTNCHTCNTGLVLLNGKCLPNCPEKYVALASNPLVCILCGDNCLNCSPSDNSSCTKCDQGYVIDHDGTCQLTCSDGYTPVTSKCAACQITDCKNCDSNINTCDICKKPYALAISFLLCSDNCLKGQFNKDGVCTVCNNCPACEDGTGKCTDCFAGYFLTQAGTCHTDCAEGQVRVGDTCVPCGVTGCSQCPATDVSQCNQCAEGLFLYHNQCLPVCPNGTFVVNKNSCQDCKANCTNCTTGTDCNSCAAGFVLQGTKCQTVCDTGFTNVNGICTPCADIRCDKCCSKDLNKCKQCAVGFSLTPDNKCVDVCDAGYFSFVNSNDGTSICKPCVDHCVSCKNGSTCDKCGPNFVLYNNQCITECPVNYVNVQGVCEQCTSSSCAVCLSSNTDTCTKCISPMFLKAGSCVSNCGLGFYADSTGTCQPCSDSNCNQCDATGDKCIDCKDTWFNYLGQCVGHCPDGWVADSSDVCIKCKCDNCSVCEVNDLTTCVICKIGNLYNGKCVTVCPQGFFANENHVCQPCSSNCLECTDPTHCSLCDSTTVLQDTSCTNGCKANFVPIKGVCTPCSDKNCLNCLEDTTTCIKCQTPFVLNFDNTCVAECSDGYFSNGSACKPCKTNCNKCTDATDCSACVSGWFLFNNICVQPCPAYTYQAADNTCKYCSDSEKCVQCDATNPDNCSKCSSGILYKGKCISTCPDGTYYSDESKTCEKCKDNCDICSSAENCNKCSNPFVQLGNDCLTACPDKYVQLGNQCAPCGTGCLTCCTSNQDKCKTCLPGLFYYDHKCLTACPSGTFQDVDENNNKVCKKCNSSCVTCSNASTCDSCVAPLVLEVNKTCTTNCKDNEANVNNVCVACTDSNCKNCSPDNLGKCIQCYNNTFLYNDACVAVCPDGFWANLDSLKCEQCSPSCKTCKNEQDCLTCVDGLFFRENTFICETCSCPNIVVGNQCKTCKADHCDRCITDDKTCKRCTGSWVLIDGKCFEQCPAGTYKQGQNCLPCSSNCVACIDDKTCTDCGEFKKLYKGVCVDTCPPDTGVNSKSECIDCTVEGCDTCDGDKPDICKDCSGEFVLYQNKCIQNCPQSHFKLPDDTCGDCPAFCIHCSSATSCDECSDGYFLQADGKCTNNCGAGYFNDIITKTCVSCQTEHCKECDPVDHCSKCKEGYVLHENTCLISCPDGYFASNGLCEACNSGCRVCTSNHDCSDCFDESLVIYKDNCIAKCPSGMTKVGKVCVDCSDSNCNVCEPEHPELCDDCKHGYLLNYKCVAECPEGFYPCEKTGKCKPCDATCKECTTAKNCTSCKSGLELFNGACVSKCPDGTFANDGVCKDCKIDNCLTCVLVQNHTSCVHCKDTFFVYEGACVNVCPTGTYPDSTNTCQPCANGCLVCSAENNCSQCDKDYFNNNGICVPGCPEGTYGDCDTKACVKCSVECKTCFKNNANSCYRCADGFYRNGLTCVSEETCSNGTYFDHSANTCNFCSVIPNCINCTDSNTCTGCGSNYNLVGGVCSLPTPTSPEIISLIFNDHILHTPLSTAYTSVKEINIPAVSLITNSNSMSLLFWIRDLGVVQSFNGDSHILKYYVSADAFIDFVIRKSDNKCVLKLNGNSTVVNEVVGPNCSTKDLFDWQFVQVVFVPGGNNTYTVTFNVGKGTTTNTVQNMPSFDIISSASKIVFFDDATDATSGSQIGYISLANHQLSQTAINQIASNKPEITYPEKFTVLDSNIAQVNEYNFTSLPYHPDAYASYGLTFGVFIQHKSAIFKLVSIHYKYSIDIKAIDITVDSSSTTVTGDHGKISIPDVFTEGKWYFVVVAINSTDKGVTYSIHIKADDLSPVFDDDYSEDSDTFETIKLFYDATITFGDSAAQLQFYNPIAFVGTEYVPNFQAVPAIAGTPTCTGWGLNFACITCIGNHILNGGLCVDNAINEGVDLFKFVQAYNNSEQNFMIPTNLVGKDFTIVFTLRKLIHAVSQENNVHNIFSVKTPDNLAFSIIQEQTLDHYQSIFSIGTKNHATIDFSDVNYDFINVVITYASDKNIINAFIQLGDQVLNGQGSVNGVVATVTIFDLAGIGIHFEAINGFIYPTILSANDITSLLNRVLLPVDPICITPNYKTGECDKCYNDKNITPTKCATSSFGLQFFNYIGDSSFENLQSTYELKSNLKASVNSEFYALTGRFRLFYLEAIDHASDAVYTLISLSNDGHASQYPVDPSRKLIALNIEVKAGVPSFVIIVNTSVAPLRIYVDSSITFDYGNWYFFFASIDLKSKSLYYIINSGSARIENTVNLPNFPEKLQNVGKLRVFGGDNYKDLGESLPQGEVINALVFPNPPASINKLTDLFENGAKYQPPVLTAIDHCAYAVYDFTNKKTICIYCSEGYIVNAQFTCDQVEAPKTTGYVVYDSLASIVDHNFAQAHDYANGELNVAFSFRVNEIDNDQYNLLHIVFNAQPSVSVFYKHYEDGEYVYFNDESNKLGPFDFSNFLNWNTILINFKPSSARFCILPCDAQNITDGVCIEISGNYGTSGSLNYNNGGHVDIAGLHSLEGSDQLPALNMCARFVCPITCSACVKGQCVGSITDKAYFVDLPAKSAHFLREVIDIKYFRASTYTFIISLPVPAQAGKVFILNKKTGLSELNLSAETDGSYTINLTLNGIDFTNTPVPAVSSGYKYAAVSIGSSIINVAFFNDDGTNNVNSLTTSSYFGFLSNDLAYSALFSDIIKVSVNEAIDAADLVNHSIDILNRQQGFGLDIKLAGLLPGSLPINATYGSFTAYVVVYAADLVGGVTGNLFTLSNSAGAFLSIDAANGVSLNKINLSSLTFTVAEFQIIYSAELQEVVVITRIDNSFSEFYGPGIAQIDNNTKFECNHATCNILLGIGRNIPKSLIIVSTTNQCTLENCNKCDKTGKEVCLSCDNGYYLTDDGVCAASSFTNAKNFVIPTA